MASLPLLVLWPTTSKRLTLVSSTGVVLGLYLYSPLLQVGGRRRGWKGERRGEGKGWRYCDACHALLSSHLGAFVATSSKGRMCSVLSAVMTHRSTLLPDPWEWKQT